MNCPTPICKSENIIQVTLDYPLTWCELQWKTPQEDMKWLDDCQRFITAVIPCKKLSKAIGLNMSGKH